MYAQLARAEVALFWRIENCHNLVYAKRTHTVSHSEGHDKKRETIKRESYILNMRAKAV